MGRIAVAKFNAPGPIQYAKGTSTVVFGDFMGATSQQDECPAVMFTIVNYSQRHREAVAVCLFWSMDNFPEYIRESGPRTAEGWTSLAARSVFKYLKSQGRDMEGYGFLDLDTRGDMAFAALQIARDQGTYKGAWECAYGLDRPWERSYTYGDAVEAQWLAQIYLDMTREEIYLDMTSEDLEAGFEAGFDMESFSEAIPYRRVLIDAPLWIRTPGPRAVRLYAHCDDLDDPKEDPRLALTKWLRRHGYRLATASIQKAWRTTSVPTQRNGRRTITHYCQGSDLANSSWQICTSRRPG